jgi:hypothetical protein
MNDMPDDAAFPPTMRIFRRDRQMTMADHMLPDDADWQTYRRADLPAPVRVKELVWSNEPSLFTSFYDADWADTSFGNYYANEYAFWFEAEPATPCEGKAAAKAAAQADYTARILAALEPAPVAMAAIERAFWLGRSCGGSKAEIDAALAQALEAAPATPSPDPA